MFCAAMRNFPAYFYAFLFLAKPLCGEAHNWKQSSIFAPLCARAEIKYAKKSSGHDIFEDTRFAPFLCVASFAARTFICSSCMQFSLHARLTDLFLVRCASLREGLRKMTRFYAKLALLENSAIPP
jgi:hypothetical protein